MVVIPWVRPDWGSLGRAQVWGTPAQRSTLYPNSTLRLGAGVRAWGIQRVSSLGWLLEVAGAGQWVPWGTVGRRGVRGAR